MFNYIIRLLNIIYLVKASSKEVSSSGNVSISLYNVYFSIDISITNIMNSSYYYTIFHFKI